MAWTDSLPNGYHGQIGEPDLGELQLLIAAVDAEFEGSTTTTVDSLRTTFGAPGFDPATDIATVTGPSGDLVGATTFQLREPYVSSFSPGYVHPDHVGLGIGGTLVDWLTRAAESSVARAAQETRVTMSIGAPANNVRAKRLLESRGFEIVRYFLEMEIGVDEWTTVSGIPDGVTLRTISPDEDVDQLSAAATEAFRDHFGFTESPAEASAARWRQWRTSEMWDDELVWLAEADNRIVGINVCLATNGARTDQGYVASLGVLPAWRGRGLARYLLTTSFVEYRDRGFPSVALHVDADSLTGATRLYEGVGMRESQRHVDYERELRDGKDIVRR